ncbi:unnamed protein product [Lepidochelys kempii]
MFSIATRPADTTDGANLLLQPAGGRPDILRRQTDTRMSIHLGDGGGGGPFLNVLGHQKRCSVMSPVRTPGVQSTPPALEDTHPAQLPTPEPVSLPTRVWPHTEAGEAPTSRGSGGEAAPSSGARVPRLQAAARELGLEARRGSASDSRQPEKKTKVRTDV